MLCMKLKGINRVCKATSGGVARVWIFDGADFSFTQTTTNNVKGPYTAITDLSADPEADPAVPGTNKIYPIKFEKNEAEYRYEHSRNGRSVKYDHTLEFRLPDLDQFITNWNESVDAAGCCDGIGLIIQLNSGKIFVAGEKIVNGDAIDIPFEMLQNGSSGTSGRLLDDPNGQTTVLAGSYRRGLYEYTGTLQSLIDLEDAD